MINQGAQGASPVFASQRGMVTIIMVLVLMAVMSILTMTTGKFVFTELETVGADYRAQEGIEATTAGLEYAMAWLDDGNECENCVNGVPLDFEGSSVANTSIPNISNANTGYSYNPTVTLTRADEFLLVASSLGAVGGSSESGITITGSEQVYVTQWNQYLTPEGESPPPIVVNGCLTNSLGTPDVYPNTGGPAILTLATSTPIDWSDPDAPDEATSCLSPNGHMSINLCADDVGCAEGDSGVEITDNDELDDHLVGQDHTGEPYPQAWNFLFGISLVDAKQAALDAGQTGATDSAIAIEPVDDNYVPFINYTGSTPINEDFGTADYPVVVIVSDASCPQFNGGSTVYGYLYYEAPDSHCNGFGGANVVGSIVFEGDVQNMNANTGFYGSENLGINPGTGGPLFVEDAARIPGTWRDW